MIEITFYGNLDINAELEYEVVQTFNIGDLEERINDLKKDLPTYEKLSPSPVELINTLGELKFEASDYDEKSTLYLINSVLINFIVYRDIERHGGMDKDYQAKYELDLNKLVELFKRLKKHNKVILDVCAWQGK